jgi:hypothetical protein
MTELILSEDQAKAKSAFVDFLLDPNERVFVLKGYSGTGKSTLTGHLIETVPNIFKTARLLDPSFKEYEIDLTATTNKAAENLAFISGMSVSTIHSYLGLMIRKDFKTEETFLSRKKNSPDLYRKLLFIDEASFIDRDLLKFIFQIMKDSKIVFMGDPAQLTPVKSGSTPVFDAKWPGAELTQVMRQAEGNPIMDLSTKFRHTVNTGEFFSFSPDGHHIRHMSREEFNNLVAEEFGRPDWKFRDSKLLGWTNKCVVNYNHAIREHVGGTPEFQVGDYAICNSFVSTHGKSLKTDQMVCISKISEPVIEADVLGRFYTLDGSITLFMPNTLEDRNARIKRAKAEEDVYLLEAIDRSWVDLRAAYACTVNKSQGSTFDKVFIDLDDIARCNSGDQIARMLYVGVSRARHHVIFTGDLA